MADHPLLTPPSVAALPQRPAVVDERRGTVKRRVALSHIRWWRRVVRVVDLHVMGVNELVQTVFSGLSPLVMEDVVGEGERIVVRARTPLDTAVCPVRGASWGRVHGYHWRTVADVPVDGRRVVVRMRVRRLVCPTRLPPHLPRTGARGAGAIPATHRSSDQAGQGRGQRVSGPGGITFAGDTRGGPVPSHGPAHPAAHPVAHRAGAEAQLHLRLPGRLRLLWGRGKLWTQATADDLLDFHDWRVRSPQNPGRVGGAKWNRELAALTRLYDWANRRRYVPASPVELRTIAGRYGGTTSVPAGREKSARTSNVHWLTPRAFRRWLDVGNARPHDSGLARRDLGRP
jgi:hypothetical protein